MITVYNELESLDELQQQIVTALENWPHTFEVLLVDDGSNDGSRAREAELCLRDARFRAIHLRRNFGKAAALATGFAHARGRWIVTMDADLQDDPSEIPALLAPIQSGEADVVSGWKWPRRDPISKTVPSKVYNGVTRWMTGLSLHDMNCGLKAYRTEVTAELTLYGDMHRYIPVMAHGAGFLVTERKVSHRPRVHGVSKYAAGRFLRGFLDLVTVLFLTRYQRRPLHLIGGIGITLGVAGVGILGYLLLLKLFGFAIGQRPLLFLGMLLTLMAGQFMTFGLLAEMATFHQHRSRNEYPVQAKIGFLPASPPHP